ncbi:hypothetical protein [Ligilactobacillus hohenheimensis]|uniref:hypothetical protein n=1 Tax=Ligilactobacillus hohenheimensis TaxID=2991832 RepID=UPI0024BABB08|nr:hypothetical protein [Ligilactobacillus hohenheimensis]
MLFIPNPAVDVALKNGADASVVASSFAQAGSSMYQPLGDYLISVQDRLRYYYNYGRENLHYPADEIKKYAPRIYDDGQPNLAAVRSEFVLSDFDWRGGEDGDQYGKKVRELIGELDLNKEQAVGILNHVADEILGQS